MKMYGLFLFASGCFSSSEEDSNAKNMKEGTATIVLDLDIINFGDVSLSAQTEISKQLTISNEGTGDLRIEDIYLSDSTTPFQIQPLINSTIPPGDSEELTITFTPTEMSDFSTELWISSNDPINNLYEITLSGTSTAPLVELAYENTDFGDVVVGCTMGGWFSIKNQGTEELIITELSYSTSSSEFRSSNWDEIVSQLPLSIQPEEFLNIDLDYVPYDEIQDDVTFVVVSNDLISPESTLTFTGSGIITEQRIDTFVQQGQGKTDILIAVDRSSSMEDEWLGFIDNFEYFVSALQNFNADYHIATVDQDDGCITSEQGLYIDNTFDSTQVQTTLTTMLDLNSTYGLNTEKPFMLFEAALTQSQSSIGCNYGFVRPDANLVFISMSDEPEQSEQDVSYYISFLQGMKENPNEVVFHAIGGDYPAGCGTSLPYTGMYEATLDTGGLFLSICEIDWPDYFSQLAEGSLRDIHSFKLSSDFVVAASIVVKINGVQTSESWVYDETTSRVVFDESYIPIDGSVIEITYVPQIACNL